MRRILIFATTLIVTLFMSACERAGFDLDPSVTDAFSSGGSSSVGDGEGASAIDFLNGVGETNDSGDLVVPVEHIEGLCRSRPQKTKRIFINFTPTGQTCEWGQNGNLDPRNYFFQARIEQKKNLDLPKGAIPCDAQFEFSDAPFRYDDQFILLFNKTVLAASYDFSAELEARANGLLNYDWLDVAGSVWDVDKAITYCPMFNGSPGNCQIPSSDEQGTISLELDPGHIQSAVAGGIPSEQHSFQMVTIGDNDNLDCEHTGLSFDVIIRYIE